jgi:hypothetical protein
MMSRDPQHDQTQLSGSSAILVVVVAGVVAGLIALTAVTRYLGPPAIPIWAIAVWGGLMIFRGPVGQAIARNIGGHVQDGPGEVPSELYAELDELRARVGELEERVDFSERLLAQGKNDVKVNNAN